MNNTKQKYRIEIPSKNHAKTFVYWIGADLELVTEKAEAVAVTEEESILAMERIGCVATCYREEPMTQTVTLKRFGPAIEVELPFGLYTAEILEEIEQNERYDRARAGK